MKATPKILATTRINTPTLAAIDAQATLLGITRSELISRTLDRAFTPPPNIIGNPLVTETKAFKSNLNVGDTISGQKAKLYAMCKNPTLVDRLDPLRIYSEPLQAVLSYSKKLTKSGQLYYIVVAVNVGIEDLNVNELGEFTRV